MSLHNLIANGGKVLILGGYDKDWPELRDQPQLEFWSGDSSKEIATILRQHNNTLPANVKAVIISRFVSHTQLAVVMKQARARHLTVFPNKNTGEVRRILSDILNGVPVHPITEFINQPRLTAMTKPEPQPATVVEPVVEKPIEQPAPKIEIKRVGQIKALVLELDNPEYSIRESAHDILKIAEERKIITTLGSLDQTIRMVRKERGILVLTQPSKGHRKVPTSTVTPKPEPVKAIVADNLLRAFDDAIAALQLVRELALKQQTENEQLRTYKEKMIKRVATLLSLEEDAK